jgi:hypothetical protein
MGGLAREGVGTRKGVRTEEARKARVMVCWARVMAGGRRVAQLEDFQYNVDLQHGDRTDKPLFLATVTSAFLRLKS